MNVRISYDPLALVTRRRIKRVQIGECIAFDVIVDQTYTDFNSRVPHPQFYVSSIFAPAKDIIKADIAPFRREVF
jgi:hypothetical protein